jgi:hypothetical protein
MDIHVFEPFRSCKHNCPIQDTAKVTREKKENGKRRWRNDRRKRRQKKRSKKE